MPFWFWNDRLEADELLRQIDEFESHGVYGSVIHPRVGLPRDCGWMSERLLGFMHLVIEEAYKRDMTVLLYDEGMYPSGSASGQVVAADPSHACRCLAMDDADTSLPDDHNVLLDKTINNRHIRIVDRRVDSVIRGLHYINDGPAEDEPAMADILNPDAVASFINLVYGRYYSEFGQHFGNTIQGIFTDEPNPLGRCREQNTWPGTTNILSHINRLLGKDFAPYLLALWFDDFPDAELYRAQYMQAIRLRLEETWYAPLSAWCGRHKVALCGHPAEGDEIGSLRYFQTPGQDLVWRWVEPDTPTAIVGPESTQAKASSSAALHLSRERNSNEFCGAYGHETTFDEFKWLAYWCLVRGVNMLIPHAFYYSTRGPRRDERPPQVGPHASWWNEFKPFADQCRQLCHLNATSEHVCDVAILTSDRCPWRTVKELYEHQVDFNYLENRLLLDGTAIVTSNHIAIGPMHYRVLIVEDDTLLTDELCAVLKPFEQAGRVIHTTAKLIDSIRALSHINSIIAGHHTNLRIRQLRRPEGLFTMLFNEAGDDIDIQLIDRADRISIARHELVLVQLEDQQQ